MSGESSPRRKKIGPHQWTHLHLMWDHQGFCPPLWPHVNHPVMQGLCDRGLAEVCKVEMKMLVEDVLVRQEMVETYRLTASGLALFEEPPVPECSIDECSKPLFARGWCVMHYRRWYRDRANVIPSDTA